MDYFGPLWIRTPTDKVKVWVCLFTCLATRAIHLEVAMDLSAVTFLNCLRRFISRRGQPTKIISDNAPQFTLTQGTIESISTKFTISPEFQQYCANEGIQWHFITEYAPWQGGVYERMVGIAKSTLKKSIGRKMLTMDELQTFLCEAEAVVNSRPLTYISEDIDSPEILRPIDFLIPHGQVGAPQLEEDGDDPEYIPKLDSRQKLLKFWRNTQQCLDKFWQLWNNDYLQSLRERFQKSHPNPRVARQYAPEEGSVVLLKEENVPRAAWKLGRVSKLISSHDGAVRSAEVTLPNKKKYRRPINLLYPLELHDKEEKETTVANYVKSAPQVGKFNFVMVLTIFLFFIGMGLTTKCPDGKKMQLTPIHSRNCTRNGIVVFKTNSSYCWNMVDCPKGHLNGKGQCKEKCHCPKWAFQCTQYRGSIPKSYGTVGSILSMGRVTSICSFQPDPKCKKDPTYMKLHQIELFNNTKVFVKSLDIQWMEHTRGDHFDCVGDLNGKMTGTPTFCASNKCHSTGTKFCYYDSVEIPYYTNAVGSIPVKAFGTVQVKVYQFQQSIAPVPTCADCEIQCTLGGVQIGLQKGVSFVEVCSKPYCIKYSFPAEELTVMFPKEINMVEHVVDVNIWTNGEIAKNVGIKCPSQPFCEMITCYFCLERVKNLHCSSTIAVMVLVVSLYFISVTVYMACTILWMLSATIKHFCSCVGMVGWCCWKVCKRARNKTYRQAVLPVFAMLQDTMEDEPTATSGIHTAKPNQVSQQKVDLLVDTRKSYRAKLPYFVAIIGLVCIGTTNGCSLATTLTAEMSMCMVNKQGMECTINQATRLVLVPQGQETCLLIRSQTGEPLGTIHVEVSHISLKCNKKSEYFTRSYRMSHQAVKRCPGVGSCYDAKCAIIQPDTVLEEFASEVNDSPGHTRCVESCGSVLCGCFLLENGCTFFRTYAEAVSNTIFEIFSCPEWEYSVDIVIKIEERNNSETLNLSLKNGIPINWNTLYGNLQMTLVSVSTPPAPILGSRFLTDGNRTALVQAAAPGQPVPGTVGSFQCSSKAAAANFNCHFPSEVCSCNLQGSTDSSVACTCVNGALEPVFANSEAVLPLTTSGITLFPDEDSSVKAEFGQTTALEIQTTLEDLKLQTQVDKSVCKVLVTSLTGCYNCLVGAKMKYSCK
ncbi:MAG: DDE-type integrase/transposase/recombinase, partial [Cytophagales bacterium]|nr:DDE-type integrase/transposase/recombinase [Cytophagales bacterium]